MKITTLILCLILFIGCNYKKESLEEEVYFPTKDKFILSDYHRYLDELNEKYLDSLRKVDNDIIVELEPEPFYDSVYNMGFTHFIILDDENIYVHQMKQKRKIKSGYFNCVVVYPDFIEERREFNMKRLDSLISIKPAKIKELLVKNKKAYIKNDTIVISGEVTIALKNDTIKGSLMYDILELLKDDQIKRSIRRMNEDELNAIQRFQHHK